MTSTFATVHDNLFIFKRKLQSAIEHKRNLFIVVAMQRNNTSFFSKMRASITFSPDRKCR